MRHFRWINDAPDHPYNGPDGIFAEYGDYDETADPSLPQPPGPPIHSAIWCADNPQQAALDLDRMGSAIREVSRLLRAGGEANHAEALVWLNNAAKK